ncbi:HAD-IIA family hydrolase [Micromonospora sp. NPDC047707]|uniref:HAD-IIA family hydrolase n=1 Tax=Micromonospora sp. NPDC047707 TaxID=3154498 RepID=UPI003451587B
MGCRSCPRRWLVLVDQFDAFLIDLDGVVYVDDEPLPGALDALVALRRRGRWVRFVTNDPRPTREELVDRLSRIGVAATVDEIVSSGWATARWLRQQNITHVHVLGSRGLEYELRMQGLDTDSATTVEAVVVGCDEDLTYRDVRQASSLICAGARFVATNLDATFPTTDGPWPATGAIVAAIATASGKRPVVIGKPGPEMFRLALKDLPTGTKAAVVGDTVATDVVGAHRAGLPAIFIPPYPLADRSEWFGRAPAPNIPEVVVASLADLFDSAVGTLRHQPMPFPWPNEVRAGVAAVVVDATGRILLGRRADNGMWALPSGHVEVGETIAQAAVREVAEETGLHVRVKRLVGVYSDPVSQVFTYSDGRVTHFVTACLACNPIGGRLRADGVETTEVGFFPPSQLPAPLLPMHPGWLSDAASGRTGILDGAGQDREAFSTSGR